MSFLSPFETCAFWLSRTKHFDSPTSTREGFFVTWMPPRVREQLCGRDGAKNGSQSKLQSFLSRNRIPYIDIYLMSTNQEAADRIQLLLQSVPHRLHQLQSNDFFSSSDHALYPSVGVDRCANLYAATHIYGKAVLVVDGGTALTWTATNANGKFMGSGGITLGIKAKCAALCEFTGALPQIEPDDIKMRMAECERRKRPLSSLAGGSAVDAMVVGMLSEMAWSLSRVIASWVDKVHKEWEEEEKKQGKAATEDSSLKHPPLRVVVTGGDFEYIVKLLNRHFSYILEPNKEHGKTMEQVEVVTEKNLSSKAVHFLLKSKTLPLTQLSKLEKIRHDLLGTRVIQPKKNESSDGMVPRIQGTVFDLKRDNSAILMKDIFKIKYDNGETEEVAATTLFGKSWNPVRTRWARSSGT